MNQSQRDTLRYRYASQMVSPNSSKSQQEDSAVIIGLLDLINFYQDELDRVRARASDAPASQDMGEGHTGPCREGCKCMGPARVEDDSIRNKHGYLGRCDCSECLAEAQQKGGRR